METNADHSNLSAEPPSNLLLHPDPSASMRNDLEALQQADAEQRTFTDLRTLTKLGKDLNAAQVAYLQAGEILKKAQISYDLGGGYRLSGVEVGFAFVSGLVIGGCLVLGLVCSK
ncbi:unnamed protein product [Zymoseptoria tritici ST99CH_3D1]|nr:unnamed protein product [Zymoseptoria tritici ST99CH_3D1]